ncbi:hypothetical protein [Burkholderia multivorans]|uniref:hypothetical protein n=1 Tax=Burkholderia multivorans TaxID=87883 RepID=UPI0012D882F2|nr:hypothetical protein [Burkholderia multivorans]
MADIFKFLIFSRRARVGMRVRICGQRGSQSIHVNRCFQVQTLAMPSRLHDKIETSMLEQAGIEFHAVKSA